MNFLDIANRHSREQAEADPNVTLMIIHPEGHLDAAAMIQARAGVEVVHREPGLGDDTILYVRCDDEGGEGGIGAGLDVVQALPSNTAASSLQVIRLMRFSTIHGQLSLKKCEPLCGFVTGSQIRSTIWPPSASLALPTPELRKKQDQNRE